MVDIKFQEESIAQKHAGDLYRKLYSTFIETEKDGLVYPESYCGSWIDEGNLVVALTDISNEVITYYNQIFDCDKSVVYIKHEFSLNDLKQVGKITSEHFIKDYEIYGYYLDYISNKVVIEVADDILCYELNDEVAILSSKNFYNTCLTNNSEISNMIRFDVGDKIANESIRVVGGMKMNKNSSTGPDRSIGVCGTITTRLGNSYEGFVTAAHNLAKNSTVYVSGEEYGTVTLSCRVENRPGDFAFVELESDMFTNTHDIYGSSSSVYRHITGYDLNLAVNENVYKYGMESQYAYGKVIAVDCTNYERDSEGNVVFTATGLTKCSLTRGTSTHGDSGGPYYHYASGTTSGTNYNFVGIHYGSNADSNPSVIKVYFTPYDCFDSYFVPKTS